MRSLFRLVFFITAILASFPAFAQEKAFFHEETDRNAKQFEAYLVTQWPSTGDTAKGFKTKGQAALKANDMRRATGSFASAAVLDKTDADTWLSLARAYLAIETDKENEKASFQRNAASSAYLAYSRAKTAPSKAAALAVLAESLTTRYEWRAALDAYRLSLALADNAEIRTTYEQVLSEHGFRMLDYTVDSDAASPRLCLQFSEPLAKGRIDFAKFVSVNGADPASVRAEGEQLCIEELLHGKRYQVKIRNGVPSTVDEALAKPIDITVYIRDRKPAIRFTTQNYVLPRTGQQGIPVVAINTKLVKVEIYNIGDRSITSQVLDGSFGEQLESYKATELKTKHGQLLWKGEMPVNTKLNEEATVAFPIDELLPNLKPGLYVMTAAPSDGAAKPASAEEAQPEEDDSGDSKATQWFVVSDLGLTAMSGSDGVHAFVRSLADAKGKGDIEVRLLARNNEVLGTAKTDASGYAKFDAGLTRGEGGLAPAMIVVRDDADYGFLDLTKSAFDLSDRGVGGRQAPGPLDAMLYTERGVYRSGEKVFLTALLRDAGGKAVPGVPLTLKIFRPDNVEHERQLLKDEGAGGRSLTLPIASTAMTGTWRVSAHADPKAPAIGEVSFLVEDYTPERLEMTLSSDKTVIGAGEPATIKIDGRYLYGAPAAQLGLEGEINISARDKGPAGFEAWQFGLEDEHFAPQRKAMEALPSTDNNGHAEVKAELPALSQTTKPLKADVILRLREPSGRVLVEATSFDVRPAKPFIGIKPQFSGGHAGDGSLASFDVVVLDRDGKPAAMQGLKWELSRIETRFQWYSRNGRWDFEKINYVRKAANGTVNVEPGKPAKIDTPVQYGRFRLEVTAQGDIALPASTAFQAGWYVSEGTETPDVLDLALDKPAYKPGDMVNVQLSPRMAGEAMVAVVSDKLLAQQVVAVPANGASVSFTVDEAWGPGAYIVAELYRPMDVEAKRMPSRAIGAKWIAFDAKPRTLDVALETPEKTRPNQKLTIPVKVAGAASGDAAYVTVSAVDLGILNLTNYPVPQPEKHYFGQRRLATELRDLYGKLIDGMQGIRGTIRSGGDGSGLAGNGRPLNVEPIAFYSGIVQVRPDGTAQVSFDIPAFDGTLRVMAAAWSGNKVGHASRDVIVRDPLVVQGTPPKFLIIGDSSELHLSLANVEGADGQFSLTATSQGAVSMSGGNAGTQSISLKAQERKSLTLPLTGHALGKGTVKVAVAGPGGINVERSYTLDVAPAAPNVTRRTYQALAAKSGVLTITPDVLADLIPGTERLTLSAGRTAALDVPGLLLSLDRYPYGCAEQTVSRALPLLYLNEVADTQGLAGEKGAKERVERAIERLASLQDSSGSFGLWSPGGYDLWLTSYVTDFMLRSQEKGYRLRSVVLENALDRLRNSVNYATEFESGGEELAYALYVLARAGRAVVGDLRYYVDEKLEKFATPLAQAQLGAALAMYGDKERAERAFNAAIGKLRPDPAPASLALRTDYGTALRDTAATLTLVSETNSLPSSIVDLAKNVSRRRATVPGTTTQENAWMLLAANALINQSRNLQLTVDGKVETGPVQRVMSSRDLAAKPFTLKNSSDEEVSVSLIVNGASAQPEPAVASGFTIERKVYSTEGKEVKFDRVKQNDRFVVVLKVSEAEAKLGQIIVEDRLPAGFEVENPKLLKGTDLKAFPWLDSKDAPVHTAFRDDRFTAAFTKSDASNKTPAFYTLAYVMRAVSPGSYTHPGAYVEDMYRPERFARTAPGKVDVVRE
jgi:alpha-2-macroglobulin